MASEEEGLSLASVGGLRVVDLKEELKSRGLATDGKKVSRIDGAELVEGSGVFFVRFEVAAAAGARISYEEGEKRRRSTTVGRVSSQACT